MSIYSISIIDVIEKKWYEMTLFEQSNVWSSLSLLDEEKIGNVNYLIEFHMDLKHILAFNQLSLYEHLKWIY